MSRDIDTQEAIDKFMDQNQIHRFEGRTGVTNLCRIIRALGYRDPNYFGQLSSDASIGDLICFLEDNPGAIEAIIEWVSDVNSEEMRSNIAALVCPDDDEDEDQQEEED